MRRKNLENQRHGKWRVLRRLRSSRSGHTLYECMCQCGAVQSVFSSHLISGKSRGCLNCSIKRNHSSPYWRGYGEISGNFWDSVKRGASGGKGRRNPIDFELTIEDAWNLFLIQGRKCALSGLPLSFPKTGKDVGTASIDRIDSERGYILSNIQWVHKDVNMMKRCYDQQYFIEVCTLIASNCNDSSGQCEISFEVKKEA